MKKKGCIWLFGDGWLKKKVFVMKWTVLLVLLGMLQVSAKVHSQHVAIDLKMENSTIEQVLQRITDQTCLNFFYNNSAIDVYKKISVELKSVSVEEALKKIFDGQEVRFDIDRDFVVIRSVSDLQQEQVVKIVVQGIVKDEAGQALPGATIKLKGTSFGVATDVNGNFKFEIPVTDPLILVVSFVGMQQQEIAYKNQPFLEIVMKNEVEMMSDVVVTGYYSANKKTYTGSATQITQDQIAKISSTNVFSVITSMDPSFKLVNNNQAGSNPNVMPKFELRGASSIPDVRSEYEGDPNMPVFIVDGFEMSVEKVFDLDPGRIATLTILKDASATAIYGSRASNGVVVIETRAPEPGKINVAYALNLSLTTPDLSDYDLLNAREKLDLEVAAGYFGYFDEAYNRRLKNIQQGYDTDWLSQPLQNAISHQHSLTLDGGNEAFRYAFHLNMNPSDGVMKKSGRDRYAIDVDLQYRLKQFTFRNQLAYDYVKAFNSPNGSFSSYTRLNPYYRYRDDQGQYVYIMDDPGVDVYNPLWNTTLNNKDQSVYNLLTDHFSIDWWVTDALRIKASASVSVRNEEEEVFKSPFHTDFKREKDMARRGTYDVVNSKSIGYEAVLGVSYTKMVKKNYVTFNGGYNVSSTDLRSHGYSVLGFPADELNDPGCGLDYHPEKKPTGNSELSRMAGFFGNLNYTYDNRYFADFSVRADASSRFGADKRWAVFWSAGVGYNLHNEVFLKKLEWVSLLRLRASYGVTGGQNFNPYQAMTTYRFITDKWYGYGSGAEMLALGNDDLKWQSTVQKNFGLDLGMWKDRLTLTFNYYHKLSENSLTDVTLPPSLGFPSYKENLGEVVNEGWEFTLRGFVVKKEDFNIMLSVNGAQNNNKLKKISNSLKAFNEEQDKQVENKVMARYVEGQSLNTIWVVRSLGIDPANGKELFLDKNGKRTYDWNADDYVAEATTDPRLYGNLGLGIFYRGFSLNTYVNYSLGEKAYNQTLVDRVENADKHYNCDRRVLYDRWHKPGDETFFKDVKDASVTRPTSRFVQKNNYLNMTSLNVAYEFNPRLLEPLRIKYLKLAFYMTDLFRISTMKAERGLDYPFARTFTTSLQIRF